MNCLKVFQMFWIIQHFKYIKEFIYEFDPISWGKFQKPLNLCCFILHNVDNNFVLTILLYHLISWTNMSLININNKIIVKFLI